MTDPNTQPDPNAPKPESENAAPPPPPVSDPATSAPPPAAQPFDERTFSMFIHLSVLVNFIPLAGVIIPIVLWSMKKDESEFVRKNGYAVFNFMISFAIYFFVASILHFVLIEIILLPIVGLAYVIFAIIGGIKASSGEIYRSPVTIPFFKV